MRSLQAEGLIEIVPRRYSVVTRMSHEDAEDVCYARYVLEDASVSRRLGPRRRGTGRDLRLALEHMSVGARRPMTWTRWWPATRSSTSC